MFALAVLTGAETVIVTFFYPSTEWKMVQPFDCLCGSTVRPISLFFIQIFTGSVSGRGAWGESKVP